MEQNLYVAARKVCRYPPVPFCYDDVDYRYFPTNEDLENYYRHCYRSWFFNEIINNRLLMFNVFIRKIPLAISLFEEIINSDEFFNYIICQTEKFNLLREVLYLGTYPISDLFTEYIIIPATWNKYLPKIFDTEFNAYEESDFFIKFIDDFRKHFPLKINFDEKVIQFVKTL